MGAAGLDDVPELSGLGIKGGLGALEGGDEIGLDFGKGREVHCCGDDVVGGLALVYVVVGMDDTGADVASHDLGGSVGDDLVGVHISRGAGAGLEDVEDEMVVKLAVDDFLGGLDDGVFLVGFQQAEAGVDLGGGELYQAEGSDEGTGEPQVTDGEVEDGPHGRSAVVGVGGDLHRAHGVFFYSGGLFSGQVEVLPSGCSSRGTTVISGCVGVNREGKVDGGKGCLLAIPLSL